MMRANIRQTVYAPKVNVPLRPWRAARWHDGAVSVLHQWSIPGLRVMLGVVFFWFGTLKLLNLSPVIPILERTYSFIPVHAFVIGLGIGEMLIGGGLIMKRALRWTLVLLCLHLTGTFASLLLAPSLFFQDGSPFRLTVEGEFVAKNIVLLAAGLVIWGYEVAPFDRRN